MTSVLRPGHRLHVLGIDQHHLACTLQDVEHGLPIVARALDGHMRATTGQQPIGEHQQLNGHRPKGPGLLPLRGQHTGDHRLLVHVQAGAPLVHDLHSHLRVKKQRLAWIPETSDADVRAQRRQLAVPAGIRVRLLDRLGAPVSKTTSGPAAQLELYHIFMGGGDHRSWRLLAKSEMREVFTFSEPLVNPGLLAYWPIAKMTSLAVSLLVNAR